MTDLRSCPSCGSDELTEFISTPIDGELHWIECLGCGVPGPYGDTEQESIDAWNKRDERVCVWVKNEKPFTYHNTGCGHDLSWSQTPKFCTECGGKVEVTP